MPLSRRRLLRSAGCAGLTLAGMSAGLERLGMMGALAATNAPTDYKALVCIFLSGGNDGNNTVLPIDATGYQQYSTVRSASGLALPQGSLLSVSPPSIGTAFGLHPSLAELHQLYGQAKLAVVTNVGPLVQPLTRAQYQSGSPRPYQLFSHSDQVTQWQTARADRPSQIGWGGLLADKSQALNAGSSFPLLTSIAGVSIFCQGEVTRPLGIAPAPTALNQVLVLNGFSSSPESVARRSAMDALRTYDTALPLVKAMSDTTQQALDVSAALSADQTLATAFPATSLGNQLLQVAKLIKLNQTSAQLSLNRQIFFCSLGGFDTHTNQLATQVSLLTALSQAMKAFYDATVELGVAAKVTTFTLSDFGRTLQPSGSSAAVVGSDHGWGSHLFVLGGAVKGGDFYGVAGPNGSFYPTLQLSGPSDADSRGRWIPTVSVEQYASTLATWFGLSPADLTAVFPLLGRFTTSNLGFMT